MRDAGPAATTLVGGACRADSECTPIAGSAFCLTESAAAAASLSAPGGYCTSLSCNPSAPASTCGLGTACADLAGMPRCVAACGATRDCRNGYDCLGGGCLPRPASDAGTPDSGDAGTSDAGDAGMSSGDAGTPDAGTTPDAGAPDGGIDAGPAGPPPCGSYEEGSWYFDAAACFSHSIGRAEQDGWSATVGVDHPDLLLWGPYTTVIPAGTHHVWFAMMIDNNTSNNDRIVTADVNDATDGRVLAGGALTRMQFPVSGQYSEFGMDFTNAAGHQLEFRLGWTNRAYIRALYVRVE